MKVIVVDDNRMIRKSIISSVNWEALGMQVVGEGCDGFEMLAAVKALAPDIVISDVKMPKAGGFELMEEARKLVPQLQFIMVSGYDDFRYMREAIRNRVVDYILKPIDEEELERSLLKARQEIQAGREGAREGGFPEGEILKMLKKEPLNRRDRTRLEAMGGKDVAFTLLNPIFKSGESWVPVPGKTLDRIRELVSMKTKGETMVSPLGPSLILVLTADGTSRLRSALADHVLAGVLPELKSLNTLSDLFYSHCPPIPWESLEEEFDRRTGELYGRFFSPGGAGGALSVSACKSDLRIALKLRSEAKTRSVLARAAEEISRENADPVRLRHLVRSLTDTALSVAIDQKAGNLKELQQWLKPNYLLRFADARRLGEALTATLLGLIEDLELKHGADPGDLVIDYMNHHFARPMSLDLLSGMFHINRVYLGQLIKKKTGCSFNRYLNRLRIGQAKELMLSDPQLKLNRIASEVGYSDAHYFSKIFKKELNISPREFREKTLPDSPGGEED